MTLDQNDEENTIVRYFILGVEKRETFLISFAEKKVHKYDTEVSNHYLSCLYPKYGTNSIEVEWFISNFQVSTLKLLHFNCQHLLFWSSNFQLILIKQFTTSFFLLWICLFSFRFLILDKVNSLETSNLDFSGQ